jgi:hypothetical protein
MGSVKTRLKRASFALGSRIIYESRHSFKVPKREKQELFAIIVSKKAEVINPRRSDLYCCRPTLDVVP